MHGLDNLILLGVIMLNFFVLGTSRLATCISIVALQGAAISLLPVTTHAFSVHTLLLAAGAFILKGIVIPRYLRRAISKVQIRREIEPRIGYIPSLFFGTLTTAGAFLFGDNLPLLAQHRDSLFIPTSMATLAAGFLMLITRRKAVTQVLGYLIFENGIFIFGTLLAAAMPFMVEAGVLLDLLVAIFIMGIVMNHIQREFSSMNTEHLCLLKE